MAAELRVKSLSWFLGWPSRRPNPAPGRRRSGRGSPLGLQSLESRIAFAVAPSIVADLNTVPNSGLESFYESFGRTTNGLVFTASDAQHGTEPWVTDGTPGGTTLLKDINPGLGSTSIGQMSAAFGGKTYFLASLSSEYFSPEVQLWKTDGTTLGTEMVKEWSSAERSPYQDAFWIFGDRLFFTLGSDLWQTNGTEVGTTSVYDASGYGAPQLFVIGGEAFAILAGGLGSELYTLSQTGDAVLVASLPVQVSEGAVAGSRFVFSAFGNALWATDGTEAGTVPVFAPGSGGPTGVYGLTSFGDAVYFSATDSTHGRELWKSNGTEGGTFVLKDINPGTASSDAYGFTPCGDKLFFSASTDDEGTELWATDGTLEGTAMVADLTPELVDGVPVSSNPTSFAAFDGQLYFSAAGQKLWKTDGTGNGTELVRDIAPDEPVFSASFGAMAEFNGRLFFAADDGVVGRELWSSDGTALGTSLVKDTDPGNGDGVPVGSASYLAGAMLDGMFLFAGQGQSGDGLYKRSSSGSASLVKSFESDFYAPLPAEFVSANGAVFFSVNVTTVVSYSPFPGFFVPYPVTSREVWKSDGTTGGTVRVGAVNADPMHSFGLTPYGGFVFFSAVTETGYGIYRTDGSANGTTLVADGFNASEFTVSGGKLFFVATVGADPQSLQGGQSVIHVMATPDSMPVPAAFDDGSLFSDPSSLVAVGNKLYFSAWSGMQQKLFVTDGTLGGTAAVSDAGGVFPVPALGFGSAMVPFGTGIMFFASTETAGVELWRTRVVAGVEKAVLVKDMAAGTEDSYAYGIVSNGTRASFLRYDSTDSQVPVLWESDGTAAGTKPTVFSGGSGPSVWLLSKPVGDTLYVAASDPARGSELWALKQVNNAPSAVSLSASSVAENLPAGTVVGTFSTTDPDAGDTFTYSILPDATLDGTTRFTIVGNELRTTGGFDFESKASFRVRVRSTDQGGLFVGRVLTITVSNVNEAPTALALSAMSVAENLPSGAVVGTFSTTDPDVGNTFKYTIVPDLTLDGTGRFAIVGNELRTTGSFDFEAKSSYRLRVRSTDQNGLFVARVLTINVTNVNEAPIAIALTSTSVPGNRPVGTVVGTFSTTDPDAGNTFTYIIVPVSTLDGTSQFEIVGNQLRTKASFNPAVKSSYTLRVRSTDQSGLFTARLITITVTP